MDGVYKLAKNIPETCDYLHEANRHPLFAAPASAPVAAQKGNSSIRLWSSFLLRPSPCIPYVHISIRVPGHLQLAAGPLAMVFTTHDTNLHTLHDALIRARQPEREREKQPTPAPQGGCVVLREPTVQAVRPTSTRSSLRADFISARDPCRPSAPPYVDCRVRRPDCWPSASQAFEHRDADRRIGQQGSTWLCVRITRVGVLEACSLILCKMAYIASYAARMRLLL